jgi:microsomal epoxide hydrolase
MTSYAATRSPKIFLTIYAASEASKNVVPRLSVNTRHIPVPSAFGLAAYSFAATALRLENATMALRLSPYPAIAGSSPALRYPWLIGRSKISRMIRFIHTKPLLVFSFFAALYPGIHPVPAKAEIEHRFFKTSDNVQLHYIEAGNGRTLVFVPGWLMPAEIWEPQIQHFSHRFHVIALDPRSQGKSAIAKTGHEPETRARDIKELIDNLKVDSVVLIGWSLGVLESLAYIKSFGTGRLDALVLVDNSIGEDPPPVSDPTFLPRLKKDRVTTIKRFVRGMYKTAQSEDYYQKIISQSLKTPLAAGVSLLSNHYPREVWKHIVYRTEKPILYIVTPRFREQAENLKARKPEVWIEVFEHAGHALFVDENQRFNKLMEDFIQKKVAGRTQGSQR